MEGCGINVFKTSGDKGFLPKFKEVVKEKEISLN
jgi:hypothetical protein